MQRNVPAYSSESETPPVSSVQYPEPIPGQSYTVMPC